MRPVRLRVEALQLSAGPWSNALPAAQALPLELSLQLAQGGPGGAGRSGPAGSAGALRYQGRIELPQPASDRHPARTFASQGQLELDQLPLHRLEPYFAAALNLELLRAELGLRASVQLSLPPEGLQLALRGDGAVPGLLDGDQQVGSSDLAILLSAWGPCP